MCCITSEKPLKYVSAFFVLLDSTFFVLQVSFVPRAVASKAPAAASAAKNGSGNDKPKPETSGKSNQDFRNMMLGKK